ncbi:MAG: M20/M25/M40 family metallo-hydrolase [Chloroflexi bacterium]|nr:M20/M25/M40 family metallo-hydrolase [Chloroflexota bacterium]
MPDLNELLAQVDETFDDLISLHRDLVRIPSVNTGVMPTGNETEAADYASQWLAQDGIEAEVIESAPGRGNLIANLPGASGQNKLLLMSHLDVVPVEDESKWNYAPFGAEIEGGRIYGRGTYDCKGLLACQMMAMRLLKRNGIDLSDNLVLASGADEESGGRYGFGWLAEHHPEKIKAPYAVNEGGGTHINIAGTTTYLLGVGEKGRLEVKLTVRGSSAHASTPWLGDNASYKVAEVLKRVESYQAERDTTSPIFNYLSTLAIEDVATPENVDQIIEDVRHRNPQLSSTLRALSRMTITPTMMSGGIKSNSVPEVCHITCDVRTLPHQDDAYARRELEEILQGMEGVDMDIYYMAVPNSSGYETDFAQRIKEATRRSLERDDLNWIPSISTGFTDSRFLRPLGTTTYGFNGSHPDDDPILARMHGTDESIGIKSLMSGTKIMLALAYDLLSVK